jgi:hypothetical protein
MRKRLRFAFVIDTEILQQLRTIQERTGLSVSEQIRQGIRWWLEARQWPERQGRDDRAVRG